MPLLVQHNCKDEKNAVLEAEERTKKIFSGFAVLMRHITSLGENKMDVLSKESQMAACGENASLASRFI